MPKSFKKVATKVLPAFEVAAQKPPTKGWEELYTGIQKARKTIDAPVDTIGCHMLKDPTASKEDQRYQTLVSLMLSAQTRDQCTAQAMQQLIAHNKCTAASINACDVDKVKELISCVCFYNNKAKYIKAATSEIINKHQSKVPSDYDALVAMPGLGPKMVHLFLQTDGVVMGIGVDVHVHRLSKRFGWVPSDSKTAEDTRKSLETWLPRKYWSEINVMLVGYGQTVCPAVNPKCADCSVSHLCPNAFKETKGKRARSSTARGDNSDELSTPHGKLTTKEATTPKVKTPLKDMEELCSRLKR